MEINWKTIDAPDFSAANRLYASGAQSVTGAANALGNQLTNYAEGEATASALTNLMGSTNPLEAQQAAQQAYSDPLVNNDKFNAAYGRLIGQQQQDFTNQRAVSVQEEAMDNLLKTREQREAEFAYKQEQDAIKLSQPKVQAVSDGYITSSYNPTTAQYANTFTRTKETKPTASEGVDTATGKPFTADQNTSYTYANRMSHNMGIIDDLEVSSDFTNPDSLQPSALLGKSIQAVSGGTRSGSTLGFDEDQTKYINAKRNYISALLRKESGAAIGSDEYADADSQYFPKAGDTDEVINQKRELRQEALKGLQTASGQGRQYGGYNIGGQMRNVGDIVTIGNKRYTVLADGSPEEVK